MSSLYCPRLVSFCLSDAALSASIRLIGTSNKPGNHRGEGRDGALNDDET